LEKGLGFGEHGDDLLCVVSLDGVTCCVTERGGAFWLRRGGEGVGEFLGDVVDVCGEFVRVEEEVELAISDIAAAVAKFGGGDESYGVRGADGVELFFAGVTVIFEEAVLHRIDEAVEVAGFGC
jgi:hypothetical protein